MPRKKAPLVRDSVTGREFRLVAKSMWDDVRFRRLNERAKLVWVNLLTNPNTGIIPGLFRFRVADGAAWLGLSPGEYLEAFRQVEEEGMAVADWEVGLVWLPKAIFHSWPTSRSIVEGWRNVVRNRLPQCALLFQALRGLRALFSEVYVNPEPFYAAFEKAFPASFWESEGQWGGPSPLPSTPGSGGLQKTEDGVRKTEDGQQKPPAFASGRPRQLALTGTHLTVVQPPFASRAPAFFARMQESRMARVGEVLPEAPPPNLSVWLSDTLAEIMGHYAVPVEEAERRLLQSYASFLESPWALALKPPCPTTAFLKREQWLRGIPVAAVEEAAQAAVEFQEVWNSIIEPAPGEVAVLARVVTPTGEEAQLAAQARKRRPMAEWRSLMQRVVVTPRLCGGGQRGRKVTLRWLLEPGNAERVLSGEYDPPGVDFTGRFQVSCTHPRCHRESLAGWNDSRGAVQQPGALCLLHAANFERWRVEEGIPEPISVEELVAFVERWRSRGAPVEENQSTGV